MTGVTPERGRDGNQTDRNDARLMARRKTITKRRMGLFLAKLEDSGSVTKSAIAGEMPRRGTWYERKERDQEFALAWDDAEMVFLDNLEGTGISRAVDGEVEKKPYIDIRKDGTKVTKFRSVVTKSDRLLELTLKARHPSYKPVQRVEQTSPDGSMTPAAPVSGMPNLDNLTQDEVVTMTHLLRKAHAGAGT